MSTHIVDQIEAVRFPAADIGYYEDIYLVMELGGDNNVTNMHGRRARDWSAAIIGSDWHVIGDCCRGPAASCEGGMTKLHGRQTTPETYIRAYRKALKNATSYQDAGTRGLRISGRIRFDPADKHQAELQQIAFDAGKYAATQPYFGKHLSVITFDLGNPADLALWFKCIHGTAWNNCEVYGPGTV